VPVWATATRGGGGGGGGGGGWGTVEQPAKPPQPASTAKGGVVPPFAVLLLSQAPKVNMISAMALACPGPSRSCTQAPRQLIADSDELGGMLSAGRIHCAGLRTVTPSRLGGPPASCRSEHWQPLQVATTPSRSGRRGFRATGARAPGLRVPGPLQWAAPGRAPGGNLHWCPLAGADTGAVRVR
jgi:hypothetical protein